MPIAPFSVFHSSHPPGLLTGRAWGAGNSFYMLLQRPISKTRAVRAAVLVGFPVWLVEEGSVTVYPHLPSVYREGVVWYEDTR